MKYDFTIARRALAEKGWTLAEWEVRTGIHYTTLSKALDRNTAHQTTAKAIARSLRISYRALLVPEPANGDAESELVGAAKRRRG